MKKQLTYLPSVFKEFLRTCAESARAHHARIYLVGGVVRDLLLGRDVYDLDILVEGDAIRLAVAIARRRGMPVTRHKAFGTASFIFRGHKIDFAAARSETYLTPGSLPRVRKAGVTQDLSRRDFTINAMAVSLHPAEYGRLIDPCGGQEDLRRHLVRVLHSESFFDDPTRILRAIRFEQRFQFRMEAGTLFQLKRAVGSGALDTVHPHRIRDELILIMREKFPFRCLRRAGKLTGFGFLEPGVRCTPAAGRLLNRIQRLQSFFLRSFGARTEFRLWSVYFTAFLESLSLPQVEFLLEELGMDKRTRSDVRAARSLRARRRRLKAPVLSDDELYEFLHQFPLEAVAYVYAYSTNGRLRRRIRRFIDTLSHIRLRIRGRDLQRLGVTPAHLYGKILRSVLRQKIKKGFRTKEEEERYALGVAERLSRQWASGGRKKGKNS
ncbi:MAG: hypothetical protein GF333_05545 [Candidatus Omnitrophica bacterium]|nr:hypothetical protein [Candidatus Omnitrophota bacterium]